VQRLVDGVSAALNVDDQRLTDRIAAQFCQHAMACARDNTRLLSQLAGRYSESSTGVSPTGDLQCLVQ
jgi:hypothetical protein